MAERLRLSLERSLLADWVGQCHTLLGPLVEAVKRHVMAAGKVHADDTPLPVLSPGRGETKTGRLWAYVRDDRPAASLDPPAVWFAYSENRQGRHPQAHLATFKGVLARYLGYSYISMVANTDRVAGAAEAASAIRNVLEASSRAAVDHAVNPHAAGKAASTPTMGYDWASRNNDSLIYYQAALAGSVLDLLNAAYLVSNVPDLKTA